MKLIPMTDFVIEQNMRFANKEITLEQLALQQLYYAVFLKQDLKLHYFVPCDLDGNVLEEPKCNVCYTGLPGDCHRSKECGIDENPFKEYQEAKDRCLFTSCPYHVEIMKNFIKDGQTIEFFDDLNLELSPTAQKQIGL
jgi:hypothetical protein